jgi:hypothetical protein
MTKWLLSAALILSAFPSSSIAQTKESLVGTWKLVSAKYTADNGEVEDIYGPNPIGFLTYTADGWVSVVIAASRRKLYSSASPSDAERAEASRTFMAYAGTYTFTGDKVIHHVDVSSTPNASNTEQIRSVTFDGKRMTLRGDPVTQGRIYEAHLELVWERMKPNTTDTKK